MIISRYAHATPLVHDFLLDAARERPDHVALVAGGARYRYSDLLHASRTLAAVLASRGVEAGDRVVILGDNDVHTCIAFWGALLANAVPSVISPQTREKKLAYILADCRPSALIAPGHCSHAFERPSCASPYLRVAIVWGDVETDVLSRIPRAVTWQAACSDSTARPPRRRRIDVDLATIIYTSGSTGDPKGVMHTHRSMRAAATSIGAYLENAPDDVLLNVLPLSFDYGLYQMIMAFAARARLVLERSFAFPRAVLERVAEERVTGFPGVPTIYAMLGGDVAAGLDLSRVRYVTNTAAALMRKHIETIRRTFPRARIYSMYGLTECKRVSFLPPEDLDKKPRSVGLPIPNTEVTIVDPDGNPLPPGKVGQIVVRGATVMAGYWEKPEATAKVLRPGKLPGERVLWTGDQGMQDEDGYLYFVARTDDVIKSRGEKVAPREVEEALLDIPGIREAAVIGVADPVLGQAPKAYVVLEPGSTLTARDVLRECKRRLESHMVPKEVVFRAELPKTSTGKVRKLGLEESPGGATDVDERAHSRVRDGDVLRSRRDRPR